jgi:hypothetical protein
MQTLTIATLESPFEPEPSYPHVICDDIRQVDPSEHMLELGSRYDAGLNWSWGNTPEWALLGAC